MKKEFFGTMDAFVYRRQIRVEASHSEGSSRYPYSIHPGGPKMYQDLKEQFWWHGMKREIGSYIAKCDIVNESSNINAPQTVTTLTDSRVEMGFCRYSNSKESSPPYVGPFKVLSHRGEVSYQLELPEEMSAVHNVFHISLLRKCLEVPEKTEVFKNIDHRAIDINQDLTYREVPIRILEEAFRTTRTRSIKFLKIQWSNHTEEEATWEREEDMKKEYPDLFST
ncbi:hypothetical protein QYE76_038190 [Lolium multiflorum]|uniref:Chromo domain-containing protein n=1 Tax=Lolium multiflorum TaxID=4521 RepID=A0AAD8WQP5_LOLMU|nr:hypothetical protein QYE76_038190 [Lolium multiflorum]